MKIDLHIHTREGSACSLSTLEEMIRAALSCGLDAIVVTDHGRLLPADRIDEVNEKYDPFRVFSGIEIDVESEHVLVVGLWDPDLEIRNWSWPDLHRFVRQRGGALILAHPYRFGEGEISLDLKRYPLDAVEVNSANMGGCDLERVEALAGALQAHRVVNSDAHRDEFVGIYHNELDRPAEDNLDLADILRLGASRPRRMEKRILAVNEAGGYLQ